MANEVKRNNRFSNLRTPKLREEARKYILYANKTISFVILICHRVFGM